MTAEATHAESKISPTTYPRLDHDTCTSVPKASVQVSRGRVVFTAGGRVFGKGFVLHGEESSREGGLPFCGFCGWQ